MRQEREEEQEKQDIKRARQRFQRQRGRGGLVTSGQCTRYRRTCNYCGERGESSRERIRECDRGNREVGYDILMIGSSSGGQQGEEEGSGVEESRQGAYQQFQCS